VERVTSCGTYKPYLRQTFLGAIKTTMLKEKLQKVSIIAKGSKFRRFTANPFKYALAICFRLLVFPITKKPFYIKTKTFWNEPFLIALPAATDIYLTGGKSDDSEIRLASYLINTLKPGDFFVDIGGHFGYFSRLALELVGEKGSVLVIEPADKSFRILQENLKNYSSAKALHCLAGAEDSEKIFYEFPINQSEYNTAFPDQFKETKSYDKVEVQKHVVGCRSLDSLMASSSRLPNLIKIDTEGSELEIIKGAYKLISEQKNLIIIMEFLSNRRKNEVHVKAVNLLKQLGFFANTITTEGRLKPCTDLESHLTLKNLESDNIVFQYGN
jgi:FkbM family methyltransferase